MKKHDVYTIPNATLYYLKAFDGIFWIFDEYFKTLGKKSHLAFRNFFGRYIFEDYIRLLLKEVYQSKENFRVYDGNDYKEGLSDCIIECPNKIYLVEAKARRYTVKHLQLKKMESENKIFLENVQKLHRHFFDSKAEHISIVKELLNETKGSDKDLSNFKFYYMDTLRLEKYI